MGSATFEVEPCVKGLLPGRVVVDAAGVVQGLSQLATLPDPPTGAIRTLLSSFHFEQTDQPFTSRKRASELSKIIEKECAKEDGQNIWKCEVCPKVYSRKYNLKRHVESIHPVKRKRLVETVIFECEECDYVCASQAALETHSDSHNASETTKSQRYNCAFCNKARASIYSHYASRHKIEYPEQIMFDNGNVLVHSSINTDGGKAPWFLREQEKMSRYNDVTCRLCETETCFGNQERLVDHYLVDHMVEPNMFVNLNRLFRAEKGAHLIDLPASHIPKRKQSDLPTLLKEKASRKEGNEARNVSKVNLEKLDDRVAKKHVQSSVLNCKECDQVYTNEALLNEHRNDKHAPKVEDKAKPEKYKCCFCNKDLIGIYKHYGNIHKIEYPEQILFENGNVLVRTDINTKAGQAAWFKNQKEKAESKYKPSTCRLCDADFYGTGVSLDKHYLLEHKIEEECLKRLDNLRCLFRADKGAHLVDMPTSRSTQRASTHQSASRSINSESKCRTGSDDPNPIVEETGQDIIGLIIYQCVECGIAATTCDASIEHAQLHHTDGYEAIPQTCDTCKFSFEAQCFADHSINHLNNNEYNIVKFDPSKLLSKWSEMFQGLSETHANRIKSSSIYQHTRRVKMISNMASGIPLYYCGKCGLYVRPKDVEGHCHNYNCMKNQAPGHFCPDCDIYFYTSVALTEHEKQHRVYGGDFFKTVIFNCKEYDRFINNALKRLKNDSSSNKEYSRVKTLVSVEKPPVEKQKNTVEIDCLENIVVSVFCDKCKQSIINSEFEAHAATHQNIQNALVDSSERENNQTIDEVSQESNGVDPDKECTNSAELLPQTKTVEAVNGEGGTVEPWNTDSDPLNNAPVSFDVHVEVHVQKEEDDEDTTNPQPEIEHSFECFDDFSEEMANDLKRDIQFLGFEVFGMTYIPDENMPQENTGTCIDRAQDEVNNQEKSTEDNSISEAIVTNANTSKNSNDIIEIEDSDDETEYQAVNIRESDSRPSSRDILSRMLSKQE